MTSAALQYQSADTPDYDDFRAEAFAHHKLRDKCFQKAAKAFRRGKKDKAAFYSRQGHLHTEKMREANHRASQKILEYRNSNLEQSFKVDLQCLHPNEAVSNLSKILSEKQQELSKSSSQQRCYLSVVTGKGTHSRGRKAKVKPAIIDFLQKSNYRSKTIPEKGALYTTDNVTSRQPITSRPYSKQFRRVNFETKFHCGNVLYTFFAYFCLG